MLEVVKPLHCEHNATFFPKKPMQTKWNLWIESVACVLPKMTWNIHSGKLAGPWLKMYLLTIEHEDHPASYVSLPEG